MKKLNVQQVLSDNKHIGKIFLFYTFVTASIATLLFFLISDHQILDGNDSYLIAVAEVLNVIIAPSIAFAGAWTAILIARSALESTKKHDVLADIDFLDKKFEPAIRQYERTVDALFPLFTEKSADDLSDRIRLADVYSHILSDRMSRLFFHRSLTNKEPALHILADYINENLSECEKFSSFMINMYEDETSFRKVLSDGIKGNEWVEIDWKKQPYREIWANCNKQEDIDIKEEQQIAKFLHQCSRKGVAIIEENDGAVYEVNYGAALITDLIFTIPTSQEISEIAREFTLAFSPENITYYLNYNKDKQIPDEIISVCEHLRTCPALLVRRQS